MTVDHEAFVKSVIDEKLSEGIVGVNNDLRDIGLDIFNMEKIEALIRKAIKKDFENGNFTPEEWEISIFDMVDKESIPRVWIKSLIFQFLAEKVLSRIEKTIEELNNHAGTVMREWLKNVIDNVDDSESFSFNAKTLCFLPLSGKAFEIAHLFKHVKMFLKMEEGELEKILKLKKEQEEKDAFTIDCLEVCLDAPYRKLLEEIMEKFDADIASKIFEDNFVKDSKHRNFFGFILIGLKMYKELSEKQKMFFKKIVESQNS